MPFLVSGGGIEKGSISSQNVHIDDLFPTVLAIAKAKNYQTIQTVDGKNLMPFFQNKTKKDDKKILVWHYPNNWTNKNFHGTSWVSAARQGEWKLIYFHKTSQLELYNLADDIGEIRDLAKKEPKKLKKMAKLLTQKLKERRAEMPSFKATGKPIPYPDEV